MIRRRGGAGSAGAGTTLVETMAVLLVLGVAAAVAVPALRSLSRPGPGTAAEELADAYRGARLLAAATSGTATVTLDPGSGSWQLFAGTAAGGGNAEDGGNLLTGRPGTRIVVPDDGSSVARLAVVRFDARGRARGPDVILTDGETRRVVSVDAWTGAIRLR